MKRDLLKKISKALAVVLVLGMFVSGTPSVKAEEGTTKDIAENTDYYIGDTIYFGSAQEVENGTDYRVTLSGSQLVTRGQFTTEKKWIVNIGVSLYFFDDDFTRHEIIKGVRCISGDGTDERPCTFSLLYEDPVTVSIEVINGTRKLKEEVYPNTETFYIAAHDDVELVHMFANEGYKPKPVISYNGKEYSYGEGSAWHSFDVPSDDYTNNKWNIEYRGTYLRLNGYSLISDFAWVVTYQPIDYKIKFDANGGSGNMDPIDATYDTEYTLPKSTMTHSTKIFDGWNTEKEGNGDSYDDEAKVKNLTATDGGEVTLYAQWRDPIVQEIEITDVSLTATPPCDGDKIVIEDIDEIAKQTPNPKVKTAKDAKYFVPEDGDYILAMWMKETDTLGKVEPFEGTYKDGDDFYLLVGLYINNKSYDYEPGSVPATSDVVPDKIKYVFAEALNFNVKGGTVLEYERSNNLTLVLIKGKVDSCKVEPEPKKTTPAAPVAIPMTGVDGIAFSMTDCISLLGICLAGILLNKKK